MKSLTSIPGTLLAVAGVFALSVLPAHAEIISTEQIVSQEQVQAGRDRLRDFLSREAVERQMKALGVDPDLAKQRAGALTDAEIATVAGRLDRVPAGGALDKTDWLLILLLTLLLIIVL